MGRIRAILVGVSKYFIAGCSQLPFCINDLYEVKSALIRGLHVKEENIWLCGQEGIVTTDMLIESIILACNGASRDDIFIFYFSGHGGNNCLLLSDSTIMIQELIYSIEKVPTKSKIIILDSCFSGGFTVDGVPCIDIDADVEEFAGRGYAVMASCGAEQKSGFDEDRKISLYTRFLCDALTARFLIKQGKKSLESINETIFRFADLSNCAGKYNIQKPIFRSNVGGTIFFEVEDYNPYKTAQVYEETKKYIIYAVEPRHHGSTKRLVVKIILRFPSSLDEIAKLSIEIKNKILYCEVYHSKYSEEKHRGKAANIVWCYFGYDEDDMLRGNFICRTTWVDDFQDKSLWYRTTENSKVINGVYLDHINSLYNMIKNLKDDSIGKEEFVRLVKGYSADLITAAEQCIKLFREFLNDTITEEQLIEAMHPINIEITNWSIERSDLPIPPTELNGWSEVHAKISGTIYDFSLFYNKEHLHVWKKENRKWLMLESIKRYEEELEELKSIHP